MAPRVYQTSIHVAGKRNFSDDFRIRNPVMQKTTTKRPKQMLPGALFRSAHLKRIPQKGTPSTVSLAVHTVSTVNSVTTAVERDDVRYG